MKEFKKVIIIHDKDGMRYDLNIEYNGNYFSICSQSGQGKFNPKSDIQQELLDIWNTYHLNGQSSGTLRQNELYMKLLNGERYDYNKVKDLLSKHSFDGKELTVSEYERSNKAIDEYKKELGFFNSFTNKLLKQKTETIIKYIPDKGEEKYFEDFKVSAGDYIKVVTIEGVGSRILQSKNKNRSPSHEDIVKIINKMNEVKYSDDIYISALVDKYEGKPFIYGHGWTTIKFPDNFKKDLFKLIDDLIEEEEEYNLRKITIDYLYNEEFVNYADEYCDGEVEKLMAACLHEGVSWSGLENITVNNWGGWDIEGFEYNIYTDEEADEAHLESIKSLVDDIGFEGFRGGNEINVSMDDDGDIIISKSITIESNERGNSLSSRDGREHEIKIGDTYYYLYRND